MIRCQTRPDGVYVAWRNRVSTTLLCMTSSKLVIERNVVETVILNTPHLNLPLKITVCTNQCTVMPSDIEGIEVNK